MSSLECKRIAIAGMGRSGLSVAKAAKKLGAMPTVLDQKPGDDPAVMKAVDELNVHECDAVTGWHGRLDGNEFDMLVLSPGFPRKHPAIRDMLDAGKEVVSEVEFAYRIAKAPILAITGTNGKSTTTVMLWTLLKAAGYDASLCGNISGSGYPELTLTEAAIEGADVLVAEVSSYQLEFVTEFRPKVATITNVTPDHFDRHPDFEDYLETKLRLLAKMGAGNAVVMNVDEPSLPIATMHAMAKGALFVGFSPSGKTSLPPWPDLSPGVTSRVGEWAAFGTQEIPRDGLRAPGEHNLINAMTAWEMAVAFIGRPTRAQEESMMAALLAFKGIEHRMELVGERDGVRVYNNSMCTNPAALIASSKGLGGRQHLLVGGLRKNLDFSPAGQYFADAPHKVYIFGPDPQGLNDQLGGTWPEYKTLEDAFLAAADRAKPSEIIILAPGCASADPYPNFRDRGEAFKAMAKEWLSS